MRLSKVAVVMLSFALFAAEGKAATYYVATTGNDANNGALSTPFRTISHGASVAQAGDTVYVRAGVYNDLVRISSKGTASTRVSPLSRRILASEYATTASISRSNAAASRFR